MKASCGFDFAEFGFVVIPGLVPGIQPSTGDTLHERRELQRIALVEHSIPAINARMTKLQAISVRIWSAKRGFNR